MGMSFVHGSNDGQKGIGLIMLVLIGIVPAKFVLDFDATPYQIKRSYDAALHLSDFYERNTHTLGEFLMLNKADRQNDLPKVYRCDPTTTMATITALRTSLAGVRDVQEMSPQSRIEARRYLL
jgi:low-affinity inorganic phosphate transporter